MQATRSPYWLLLAVLLVAGQVELRVHGLHHAVLPAADADRAAAHGGHGSQDERRVACTSLDHFADLACGTAAPAIAAAEPPRPAVASFLGHAGTFSLPVRARGPPVSLPA